MQKLAIAEVCERRLGNVVYDARVVEIKNRKGLRSRLLETNFDLLSKSFRKHALVYLDIDVPDAWMLFAQALLYLIYLFSHEAGDLVGIIGKKTLEFPEITSHLLKLLLHRATPVRLAQKCATIEFHLALDAMHTPAERRGFEINHLFYHRVSFEELHDLFLQFLRYRATEQIYAVFHDKRDSRGSEENGNDDRARRVPIRIPGVVREADGKSRDGDARDRDRALEVHGKRHRVRLAKAVKPRDI